MSEQTPSGVSQVTATRTKKIYAHCPKCDQKRWGTIPVTEPEPSKVAVPAGIKNGETYPFRCSECLTTTLQRGVNGHIVMAAQESKTPS